MDKKLPKIFQNKINKDISHNASYYVGNELKEEKKETVKKEKVNINYKINQIFASPRYVYKADVKINMKDKTITKKIIGKNKNHLITIDNELIPIKDIIDINFTD